MRSVNLDTWSPEQVVSLQNMGNSRARAVYEAQLPDGFRRPQTDSALETFIRAKYEHKKYMAREWVPQPPAVANWDKEIDEEMEQLKRSKKKTSSSGVNGGNGLGALPSASAHASGDSGARRSAAAAAAPVVLAKPAPSPKAGSRTTQKAAAAAAAAQQTSSASIDLLDLSISPVASNSNGANNSNSNTSASDELFSNFLSGPPPLSTAATVPANANNGATNTTAPANLSAEEMAEFWKQDEQLRHKKVRNSILDLYGPEGLQNWSKRFEPQHPPQQFGAFVGTSSVSQAQLLQLNPMTFTAFDNNKMPAQQPSFAQFPPMAGIDGGAGSMFGNIGIGAAATNGSAAASSTAALNQKLDSLNLGNVWQ